jgi:peptide/nickel transport system substrate-binding protein
MALSTPPARGLARLPVVRGFALVTAALALAFSAACAPAAPPAAPPTTAAAQPTSAPAAKPSVAAQTLVIAMPDPANLDPHATVEGGSYTVGFAVYDTLVRNKVVDGKISGDMEPHLARSWDISPDGLTWTFKLRDDVKFSDGTPLDANAVKFSFDRLVKLNKGPYASFFKPLQSTEVVDPFTVRLKLTDAYVPFLSVLATYGGSIVNPKVMSKEQSGDLGANYLAANLEGSGPFVLKEWTRSQQLVLEANPSYWGPKPTLQRIIFRSMTEPNSIRLAVTRGDVDLSLTELPPDMLAELDKQAGVKVSSQSIFAMNFGYMNNTRAPLDNVKVRQAISYAVDYDTMVNQIMRGTAQRVRGPIPPGLLGHDDGVFQYNRDVAKAKQLLADAGMPSGFSTTLTYADLPAGDQLPQIVQSNLADIGVKVDLQKVTEPTRRERIDKKEFDLSMGGWTANYSDPNMFMLPLFDSRNGGLAGNRSYYSNPAVDDLVRKAATTVDHDERVKLYRQAQDLIMQDAPYFFMFYPDYQLPIRDTVKGLSLNPSNVFNMRFDLVSKS